MISQKTDAQTGISPISYHNQYVGHLNAIISKAELTINNYKQVKELNYGQLYGDLQILSDQIDSSSTTIANLEVKDSNFNVKTYTQPFHNEYLRSLDNYIDNYEEWLEANENELVNVSIDNLDELQSDTLEHSYSRFIQSHNSFVKLINEQI